MVSENHQILISNNGKQLDVDIIGKSALYIPFSQFLLAYQLRKKTTNLNQLIQIKRNGKNLLEVENGKIKINSYPDAFRFFLKSVTG